MLASQFVKNVALTIVAMALVAFPGSVNGLRYEVRQSPASQHCLIAFADTSLGNDVRSIGNVKVNFECDAKPHTLLFQKITVPTGGKVEDIVYDTRMRCGTCSQATSKKQVSHVQASQKRIRTVHEHKVRKSSLLAKASALSRAGASTST